MKIPNSVNPSQAFLDMTNFMVSQVEIKDNIKNLQHLIELGETFIIIVQTRIDCEDPGNYYRVRITDKDSEGQIKQALNHELAIMKAEYKRQIQEQISKLTDELNALDNE